MSFELRKIKEVGKVFTGKTPSKAVEDYFGGEIPFVTPTELDKEQFVFSAQQTLTEKGAEQIKLLPKNSVMVCCIGSLGKIGIAGCELATNQQINSVIFDNKKVDFKYGYYVLSRLKPLMEKIAPLTTVPIINKSSFEQLEIPIPPLSTQTQIVQILDKSTALIAKRKAQIAELDKLVQSVFLEMFGDPITNPKKWDVRKLSDIATYFNGLTYKPDQVSESGVVVLRSSNIQNSELCFKDTVKVSCPIKEKLWVKNNDILMCSRNGSANLVGKVALIENIEEKMTFGAFMMIIRSSFYRYLMIYFQTNAFRKQIKTGATTTINQITGAMLDRIELPIPSQELLNHFSKRMTKIHAQKSLLQKSLAELEMQHQALMQKAFNGQLVG